MKIQGGTAPSADAHVHVRRIKPIQGPINTFGAAREFENSIYETEFQRLIAP